MNPGKKVSVRTGNKVELFDKDGNSRGFFDLRNRLNDLTGKEWIFSTKSVIPRNFPPSFQQKLRNKHGGQKPPELCEQLIRTFTKEGDRVLDPFAGVGGTLLGCTLSGRAGTGIEINEKWVSIYREVCAMENIEAQEMIHGDAREVLREKFPGGDSFDFVLTDVPFWKMDTVEKSKGTFKKVGEPAKGVFSDRSKLSPFNDKKCSEHLTKEKWESLIQDVFVECHRLLKPGKYCCVFIGNMYHAGRYHLLNARVADILERIGFILKGEIVWYDVGKKLHLYGINYSWIPSIVHQFIMVFRKPGHGRTGKEEVTSIIERNWRMVEKHGFEFP